jgi:hypothetical protein
VERASRRLRALARACENGLRYATPADVRTHILLSAHADALTFDEHLRTEGWRQTAIAMRDLFSWLGIPSPVDGHIPVLHRERGTVTTLRRIRGLQTLLQADLDAATRASRERQLRRELARTR